MKEKEILEILEKIKEVRLAVYGDFCLDAYWVMDPDGSEVSVETGLKAEAVAKHSYSPGGAGNIVANLAALQPSAIKLIGVVGDDIHGRELASQLQALGADTSSLLIQKENFDTYTYTKRIYGEEEGPRIDFGLKNRRSRETEEELLKNIEQALQEYDALIFNQQVMNSIPDPAFIERANALFDKYNDRIVVLDSRHYNQLFRNVIRKANDVEVAVLNGREVTPQDVIPLADVRRYAQNIYDQYHKPVFATCGPRGIVVADGEGLHEVPGILLTKKLDTVGAGDTTISALTAALAAGIPPVEAASFANLAAAVTVQKLYTTGTATAEEILALNREAVYNYRPELAEDLRKAVYLPETEFEVCDPAVTKRFGRVKHILFDNDGTISTLRQGWEEVMEPVMMKAILGDQYDRVDAGTFRKVQEEVRSYIDASTGIQTILQMEALVEMVREAGYVPEEEILDKFGYKKIYNDALMEVVNQRLEKLHRGELEVTDYTLKGAIPFLQALREKGMILYLASGTDEEDVVREATELGFAEYFNGGIYGSQNDIRKYSKKMVVDRIIRENDLHGDELVVFGDGPVEIREVMQAGGIAIGVASDEVRRYGLNPEKRTRLIRAGAQMIVPDFTQRQKMLGTMIDE
jgi:rfaE bifunctional protein kinase chain/domain